MTKIFATFALAALTTVGQASSYLPAPECYPCDASVQYLPAPECYPCDASINYLPAPECYPCD